MFCTILWMTVCWSGNKQVMCVEPLPTKESTRVLRLGDFFSWERNRKGHLLLG